MELTICSKLCNECPFSASSPKGWLGLCRGYVASATKSGIEFDNGTDIAEGLKKLQALVISENKESLDAILSKDEFVNHHNLIG